MKNKQFWINVFAGLLVCFLVIYFGYIILMDEADCLNQIAEKYPNVSCRSAEYIYCEWKGETYKVVRKSWEEGKGYNCDLEKIEDNPESNNNINESYFGNLSIQYIEPETTMTIYSNNSEEFWDAKEYTIEYNCDNPQNLTIWLKLNNKTYNIQELCEVKS